MLGDRPLLFFSFYADNVIYNMQDAGIAYMESMNGKIYNNNIKDCRIGLRLSMGSAGNEITENVFDNCGDGEKPRTLGAP